MQPCPVLIINLPSSQDRRRAAEEEMARNGIVAEFVAAIDGRLMSATELAAVCGPPGDGYYQTLLPGQVGAYLSHLKAASRIVDAGWPMAVILQDDIQLPPDFSARLAVLVQEMPAHLDLILLAGKPAPHSVVQALSNGDLLVRFRRPPYGAYAHLWTHSGAAKLLRFGRPLRRPIDVQLKHWWEFGLQWAVLRPELVGLNNVLNSVSTIAPSRRRSGRNWIRKWQYKLGYAITSRWHAWRER